MKKYYLFAISLLFGCTTEQTETVIDGCDYIKMTSYNGNGGVTNTQG